MKEKIGCKCVNCGSEEYIEYHHIVPLVRGGTNNLGNIVPLCYECHIKAHNKHIHGDDFKKAKEEGRVGRKHSKTYEECLPYIEMYFKCEIGAKEFKEKCGFSQGYKISQISYLKRYKKENNIKKFKNTVDIKNVQDQINETKRKKREQNNIYHPEEQINIKERVQNYICRLEEAD